MSAADITDILSDLKDWLEKARGSKGVNGAHGVLSEPNRSYVARQLAYVECAISIVRNPNTPPNLNPVNVGNVLPGYNPTTTDGFADACVTLIGQAYSNASGPSPSDQYVGDRLTTISYLLPGYTSTAGIT